MAMMSVPIGEMAAVGTALCWTVTSMSFEAAGRQVGSLSVNIIRLAMACVFLAVYGWLQRGMIFPVDASPHAWIWLSISGVVGFTIGDLCLFRAFVLVGARVSMLIMSLVPLITTLAGWLLMSEKLAAVQWLGMALTVLGVGWVTLKRQGTRNQTTESPVKGLLLAFGGAVGQALGLVLSKIGMGDYDPFAATQIRVLAGFLAFVILFFFIGWWKTTWAALGNKRGMAATASGAFFGPFLGVSLSLLAVQYTQTGVAATLMGLVPVFILLPSRILFKEPVGFRAVTGAALACLGSAVLFLA